MWTHVAWISLAISLKQWAKPNTFWAAFSKTGKQVQEARSWLCQQVGRWSSQLVHIAIARSSNTKMLKVNSPLHHYRHCLSYCAGRTEMDPKTLKLTIVLMLQICLLHQNPVKCSERGMNIRAPECISLHRVILII